MFSKKIANIGRDIIKNTTQNYQIRSWERCLFINIGEAPVTILGIEYQTKEQLELGGVGYVLDDEVSIDFGSNPRKLTQKVICIYEVISEAENQSC